MDETAVGDDEVGMEEPSPGNLVQLLREAPQRETGEARRDRSARPSVGGYCDDRHEQPADQRAARCLDLSRCE